MKRIQSLRTILTFGLAGFCFFASIDTSIKAQGISVQGLALAFKQAEGIEPSAVEPIGDGTNLLVADDRTQALLIVNAKRREVAKEKLPIPPGGSFPKWEAMAKDRQKNYYLIGILAGLFRFHLKDEAETTPAKIKIEGEIEKLTFKQSDDLKNCPPARIEGLTVWVNDSGEEELVIGKRDDTLDTIHVYRAKITADKQLLVKPFFEFGVPKVENAVNVKWHLSSIEYVPDWEGFLVVTSTESIDNKFYGNMLWFVSNEELKGPQQSSPACNFRVVTPIMSEVFEPAMKAEGLAILKSAEKAKLSVVIVFDNDYGNRERTKDAAALAFVELSKPPK